MNYSEISPVWIIDTLSKEEDALFDERMSQQLLAFSQNEIGSSFDPSRQRWWKIDRANEFGLSMVDAQKHPNDIPAYSLTTNKLDETHLVVVVLGKLSQFGSANKIIADIKDAKAHAQFMLGTGVTVNYYGLFSFENGQTYEARLEEEISESAFDTVFLQGTSNNTEKNTNGYHILDKKEDAYNYWDLSVQIIHHIVLTKDRLNYFNDAKLHIVGATSIIFEPEGEKRSRATKLAKAVVGKFKKEENGTRWHDKKKVALSDAFKKFHGWRNIYNELRSGYENLPTDDLHVPSKVSPWWVFSKILIKEYFKKYIKSVVRLVHENVTGYSFITSERYKNHLDNKYSKLTGDNKHVQAIEEELCSVWDKRENEKKECAIGLQQFKSKLDEMKAFFKEQKKSIEDLMKQTAPDSKNAEFPGLYDYPLGGFGDKYQKRYEEYIQKGDDGKTGDYKLKKLTRILQFHPVPLSLIVRSLILATLLPTCVLTLLWIIPDYLFNTAAVESTPGSYYLVAGCAVLCILVAVFQYLFSVVDNIRVKIKDYIAWSLYKLQLKAYEKTLDKALEYYKSTLDAIDRIEKQYNGLVDSSVDIKEANWYKFYYNTFQLNITGSYEGYRILKSDSVDYRYKVKASSTKDAISVETETDDLHYQIIRDTLIFDDDKVLEKLKSLLFDFDAIADFESFDELVRDAIEKKLSVFVRNSEASNLSDVIFYTGLDKANGNNNMAIHPENGYKDSVAKYVRVMSYPSGNVVGGYHYVSYVIPKSNNFHANHWDGLFEWSHRLSELVGIYTTNVLQGCALGSLKDLKDIHLEGPANVDDNRRNDTDSQNN